MIVGGCQLKASHLRIKLHPLSNRLKYHFMMNIPQALNLHKRLELDHGRITPSRNQLSPQGGSFSTNIIPSKNVLLQA